MANKRKFKMKKTGVKFANALDNIKLIRIRNGTDNKLISDARLTDGMVEEPEFGILMQKLSKKKRKEHLV